jgi:hypothetical protein
MPEWYDESSQELEEQKAAGVGRGGALEDASIVGEQKGRDAGGGQT